MSKIKPKRAAVREVITSFGGLSDDPLCRQETAQLIRNFRIRSDGSLEKRSGFFTLFSFDAPVRGVWQGKAGEEHLSFAVLDTRILRYDPMMGTVYSAGSLGSAVGKVRFALYRDRLYLLDGLQIHVWNPAAARFSPAMGYAPLYGRDWNPVGTGDVLEPVNLFSRRLRIHYLNLTGTQSFTLPFPAATVDRVLVNGQEVEAIGFVSGTATVSIDEGNAGDRVEIGFTMYGDSQAGDELMSAGEAFAYRDGARDYLFLFDSYKGFTLFGSRPVEEEGYAESLLLYPDADPLYITAERRFTPGDRDHPVTALCPYRGRLFAFSTGDVSTVVTDEKTGDMAVYPLHRSIGCSAIGAALPYRDGIALVNEMGVSYLTSPRSDPDALEAELLSEPIRGLLPEGLAQNVLLAVHPAREELWLRDRWEEAEGLVLVYAGESRCWTAFSGIPASGFFTDGGALCFVEDNKLLRFDETLYMDRGQPIRARYQSGFCEPGNDGQKKRSLSFHLCMGHTGENATLTLDTDRGSRSFPLPGQGEGRPTHHGVRAGLGRFRYMRYRIEEESLAPCRVYHAVLCCNP